MKRILLRADGSSEIGMGHVTRSLALGGMLAEVFECHLYTRFASQYLRDQANSNKVKLHVLPEEKYETAFLDHLENGDVVVLDNYYFDEQYEKTIKGLGCGVVTVDDLHQRHFESDLVINHSPSAHPQQYSYGEHCELLLGLDYVLLRPPFLDYARRGSTPSQLLQHFMLCFGGSDHLGLSFKYTQELIGAMGPSASNYHISVVLGPSSSSLDSFANMEFPNLDVHFSLNQDEMFELMTDIDFAIVPASSILLEVLALRKVYLTGFYADNQMEIGRFFAQEENRFLGDLRAESLTGEKIRRAWETETTYHIDGQSPRRIVEAFRKKFS